MPVPDEVEMVEGADQSHPELLKLSVDTIFDVAKSHVELDVIEFIEVEHFERIEIASFPC